MSFSISFFTEETLGKIMDRNLYLLLTFIDTLYRIAWASYKSKGPGGFPQPDNLETSAVHVSFISYQVITFKTSMFQFFFS